MEKGQVMNVKMVVIGGSAGSLEVILEVLPQLRRPSTFCITLVMHRGNNTENILPGLLAGKTTIPVKEIEDKDAINPGVIYLAPADYHLLVERDGCFSLDASEKVNFSRPNIDLTFQSAAETFGPGVTGILLSGANSDGTVGLQAIAAHGGIVCVQDPSTASVQFMPQNAIDHLRPQHIIPAQRMAEFINSLEGPK
jgi:two-component system, chemotaxis family, protein-glutamate methylesterase/glutaminase